MYSKMANIFIIFIRVLCFVIVCFNNIFIATYSIVQEHTIQEQHIRKTEREKHVINVSIFRKSYISNYLFTFIVIKIYELSTSTIFQ